jgi:TolA-binding protein
MTGSLQTSHRLRAIVLFLAAVALACPARADTVSIRRPSEPTSVAPTVYGDVKITNILDGRIVFTTVVGHSVDKDLAWVVSMSIDDEPQFDQAQRNYAAGHFDRAVDGFDQTIRKTDKPWLKTYCEPLLTDAANRSGQFGKAVEGYIGLIQDQPTRAAEYRPTVPPAGSPDLDGAASDLSSAADISGLTPQQQTSLLSLLLEVDRARNDTQNLGNVAARLAKLVGVSGNPTANLASLALADARLSEAGAALARKNYDQVVAMIDQSAALFVDPNRQAEALYILAQAREGQADLKNDPDAWRDAAVAYMRVVAHFKDAAGAPDVADSLLRTAAILENHLNHPDEALRMYQSIQKEFPGGSAADEAVRQVARLQAR